MKNKPDAALKPSQILIEQLIQMRDEGAFTKNGELILSSAISRLELQHDIIISNLTRFENQKNLILENNEHIKNQCEVIVKFEVENRRLINALEGTLDILEVAAEEIVSPATTRFIQIAKGVLDKAKGVK